MPLRRRTNEQQEKKMKSATPECKRDVGKSIVTIVADFVLLLLEFSKGMPQRDDDDFG